MLFCCFKLLNTTPKAFNFSARVVFPPRGHSDATTDFEGFAVTFQRVPMDTQKGTSFGNVVLASFGNLWFVRCHAINHIKA